MCYASSEWGSEEFQNAGGGGSVVKQDLSRYSQRERMIWGIMTEDAAVFDMPVAQVGL